MQKMGGNAMHLVNKRQERNMRTEEMGVKEGSEPQRKPASAEFQQWCSTHQSNITYIHTNENWTEHTRARRQACAAKHKQAIDNKWLTGHTVMLNCAF